MARSCGSRRRIRCIPGSGCDWCAARCREGIGRIGSGGPGFGTCGTPDWFELDADYGAIDRIVAHAPDAAGAPDDLCPGAGLVLARLEIAFIHAVCALLTARDGYGPAPGMIRETVERWCEKVGARNRSSGDERGHTLVRAPVPGTGRDLVLRLQVGIRPSWSGISFIEKHQIPGQPDGDITYRVATRDVTLDTIVATLPAPADPGLGPHDRLFAYFIGLAATGTIGPALPRGANARLVADRFAAAGVPVSVSRGPRRMSVLYAYKRETNRTLTRTLFFEPGGGDQDIRFVESWDYLPPSGAGREYHYSVATPHRGLRMLADFLARREELPAAPPGMVDEDLEDLVADCLRTFAQRGELSDGLPPKANRDHVERWFAEAGVPTHADFSVWFDSD
jgi:hypothetical protein